MRNGVQYLRDNARSHIVGIVTKQIKRLGWFIASHAPYSDEAPSDFHLFRSLEHFLREKVFNNEEEIRQPLDEYLHQETWVFIVEDLKNCRKFGKKL